jgi:hypothetical protein
MSNAKVTIAFFQQVDKKVKSAILGNIASHYGITEQEAYEEVTDEDAENLLEYLTGNVRHATIGLMKKYAA